MPRSSSSPTRTPVPTPPRTPSQRRCRARSRRVAGRTGRRPAARRRSGSTGGSWRRPWSTRSRGRTSTSGGATTATCRATIRCRTSSRSTTSCSGSATPRKARPASGRQGLPIPIDAVHPFPTGEAIGRARGAAWCAETLAADLRAADLPTADGWPAFDLLLLGIGRDGHLLSVFPGSAALDATELAMAIPAPTHIEPHVERVTLNPAVIGAARRVLVVAFGADKAPVIARDLRHRRRPTGAARPPGRARGRDLDHRRSRRGGAARPSMTDARSVAARSCRAARLLARRHPDRGVHERQRTGPGPRPRRDGRPHRVPCRRADARDVVHGPRHRSTRPGRVRRHGAVLDRARVRGRRRRGGCPRRPIGRGGRRRRPLVRRPVRARGGAPDRPRSAGSCRTKEPRRRRA